ncbi:MAG: ABC transporter substrate-binding protein [Candidatus Babeliales bacterium]|jgi:ABC-type branched-subunit amino acid transport system substrate-binding protein
MFQCFYPARPECFGELARQNVSKDELKTSYGVHGSIHPPTQSFGGYSPRADFRIPRNPLLHIILFASCAIVADAHAQYPLIPIQHERHKIIVPLCTSFPLIGDQSVIGRQLLSGVENYLKEFKHFTTEADTGERHLIIRHIKNNKDTDDAGLEAINDMLTLSPLVLGLLGPDTFFSLVPALKKKQLCLLFPIEGNQELRDIKLANVIYFRPSYEKELAALTHYALTIKHKTSIAILYESSVWGKSLLASLEKILARSAIKPVITAPYAQGTVEIEQALTTIAHAEPNAVIFLAQPRPAYNFISNALNTNLNGCLFLGLSHLGVIQNLLKTSRGLDIAVTSVVPQASSSTLPIAEEYRRAMRSFLTSHDDSPFYFESFIAMAILDKCLGTLGNTITIPALITSLESLHNENFKGLRLNFDATDRSLSSAVWINPGLHHEWITYSH